MSISKDWLQTFKPYRSKYTEEQSIEVDLFGKPIDTSKGNTKDNTYISKDSWNIPDKKTPYCLSTQARCLEKSYLEKGTNYKNVFEYTRVGSILPDFEFIERKN